MQPSGAGAPCRPPLVPPLARPARCRFCALVQSLVLVSPSNLQRALPLTKHQRWPTLAHAGPRNLPRPHSSAGSSPLVLSSFSAPVLVLVSLSSPLRAQASPFIHLDFISPVPSSQVPPPLFSLPPSTHPTLLCKSTKTKALAFDLCLPLVPGHSLTPSFVFPHCKTIKSTRTHILLDHQTTTLIRTLKA